MKANIIKIILAVAVVGVIGFFVWKWIVGSDANPQQVRPPENQFTKRVEQEIDSLGNLPVNAFCHESYSAIKYRIDDFHRQQFFDTDVKNNDRWQEILSKNLYSAYAQKFVQQAYHVFDATAWAPDKLRFIGKEVKILKQSALLEKNSEIDNKFSEIQHILNKYYEIAGFISTCSNFKYSIYDLSAEFPDMSNKIEKANRYLANNLDNPTVNHCTRLKDELKKIPQILLGEHYRYLYRKIKEYHKLDTNGDYHFKDTYPTQKLYVDKVYHPLEKQIYALDNDVYHVDETVFNRVYNRLYHYLEKSSDAVYQYYDNQYEKVEL